MVIYSKEVQNALDDIWLDAMLHNKSMKHYIAIRNGLEELDRNYINRQESQYPAWRHLNLYEKDFGNDHFGYSWDGENVVVEYHYNPLKRESLERFSNLIQENIYEYNNATNKLRNMNNKKVVRLTESQLHNVIAESVSQILMELDPRTYNSYAYKRHLQAKNETDPTKKQMYLDKEKMGRQATVDAFNRDFAYNYQKDGNEYWDGEKHEEMMGLDDDGNYTYTRRITPPINKKTKKFDTLSSNKPLDITHKGGQYNIKSDGQDVTRDWTRDSMNYYGNPYGHMNHVAKDLFMNKKPSQVRSFTQDEDGKWVKRPHKWGNNPY